MQYSMRKLYIQLTSIQFRYSANQCSGLIFSIQQLNYSIQIEQTNIISYSFQNQIGNGYMFTEILFEVQVQTSNIHVCTNLQSYANSSNNLLITISEIPTVSCEDICNSSQIPVYGLCKHDLFNGILVANGTKLCADPYIFQEYQCICKEKNGLVCTNIDLQLNELENLINQVNSSLQSLSSDLSVLQNLTDQNKIDIENQLNTNVMSLTYQIDQLNTLMLSKLQSLNQTINNNNETQTYNLDNLNTDYLTTKSIHAAQISNNQANIQNVNNSLTASITTNKNMIQDVNTSLTSKINSINNDISLLKTQDINTNNAVTLLQNNYNTFVTNTQQNINTINTGITNLQTKDQSLQLQINNHNTNISTLFTSVTNLNGYDQYLQGQVNTHTNEIAYLKSQIATLNARIDAFVAGNVQVSYKENNCGIVLAEVCGNGVCGWFRSMSLVGNQCDCGGCNDSSY
ncbi:Conserved_hypothetical protein [Hexamita inflata]|uniref:Uncharacterized protein n=1 Tax=Hexamita inflata TaxID=28002 RepID=A0ABP1J4U7_9EUKA